MRYAVIGLLALALLSFDRPWDLFVETYPTPQSIVGVCVAPVPHAELVDVPLEHAARGAVDCLAHHGIVGGGPTGRFGPDEPATGDELGRWLAEVTDRAGLTAPWVADGSVDRGALARAVTAVLAEAGSTAAPLRLPHTDVERTDAVYPAVANGLVRGRDRGTFGAGDEVTRAEVATSVVRLLAHLSELRPTELAAPTEPAWGEIPPGRRAHLPLPSAADGAFRIDTPLREDGTHARFNPCRPVQVVVNLEHAPMFARDAIEESLAAVSIATGGVWELVGETDEQLAHGLSRRRIGIRTQERGYPPVLITWPAEWPASWTGHDALAFAESRMLESGEVVTGSVRMNPDEDWSYEQLVWVLLHEIGHVAGLGHVEDPDQVMHGTVGAFPEDPAYRGGDLAGLALLGRGVGCF